MTTFIDRFEVGECRPRLAVKDLIDLVGIITTAGSRLVAESAQPATRDAACLRGARSAGVAIVGKTNLVELAFGTSGVNPWYGTPLNPLDPGLVPGGSSSGSAVAVATGEADVAFGTDTGGSIRIPSACCGTAGLKTTFGRIPTAGVWPLAPSLDTVGPMAASVAGLVLGMSWLEPGFAIARAPARRLGRLRLGRPGLLGPGPDPTAGAGPAGPGPHPAVPAWPADHDGDTPVVDTVIEEAIDAVLEAAGFEVIELELPGWEAAWRGGLRLLEAEAAQANHAMLDHLQRVDPAVAERLLRGAKISVAELSEARAHQRRWRAEVAARLDTVELLVLPTLVGFPPRLDEADRFAFTFATGPVNLAGVPALSQPIPAGYGRAVPASIQLVGPARGEELLLATGLEIEAVLAAGPLASARRLQGVTMISP